MSRARTKAMARMLAQQLNEEMRLDFRGRGNHRYFYSEEQKRYALSKIDEYGVRATARILQLSRITIQRWCRKRNKAVKRCPDWVYEWSARRRRRREFWERRGYIY